MALRVFHWVIPDLDDAGVWFKTAYDIELALSLVAMLALLASIVGGIGLLVARFPPS
jgi:hypothetical protein